MLNNYYSHAINHTQSSINYISILYARTINWQNWKPEQFKHSKVATNFNVTFKNSIFSSKQQNTQQKISSLIGKSYMATTNTTTNPHNYKLCNLKANIKAC